MSDRLTVFISSTARDLQKYRAKVKDAVLRAGAYPMAMEEFDATTRNALQLCYDAVVQADVLVGIYAHRYGFAPAAAMTYTTTDGETRAGDGQTGITHWEYLWALERGIPLLLYIISDTDDGKPMSWPVSAIEDEPGKSRLKAFKALIMGKHGVNFFTSPDDLAGKVGVAVAKIAASRPSAVVESARAVEKPLSDRTRATNRDNMLKLVEQVWVKGYLENVLNQHQALKIPMGFTDPEKVVHRPGLEDYTLPDATQIDHAFHDLNERLVILGEPGAGKTVALAQLCKALIAEARVDDRKPIPVILSLISWAAEQPPVEAWLRKELVDKYALPRKAADDFVLGEQLIYLLDGLDEVAESQRENCLKAIKVFFENERPLVQYALCSRRIEFTALKTRLDVIGELVMQPLSHAQIDQYLAKDEFEGLRVLMNDNPILQDFARIPFMLNTMAVVARGQSERKLRLTLDERDSPEALRDAFLEQYIQRRLRDNPNTRYPDLHKIRDYLYWLAHQLILSAQTDFFIENMQPDWLGNTTGRGRYRQTLRWAGGVINGLLFGLAGGVMYNQIFESNSVTTATGFGLMFGLGFTLGFILPVDLIPHRIIAIRSTWQSLKWHWLVGGLAGGFGAGLAYGNWAAPIILVGELGGAFIFGIISGIVDSLVLNLPLYRIMMTEQVVWSLKWRWVIGGVAFGVAFGLTYAINIFSAFLMGFVGLNPLESIQMVLESSLYLGLPYMIVGGIGGAFTFGLAGGFRPVEILIVRQHPNFGLHRSFSNYIRVWIVMILSGGLVTMLINHLKVYEVAYPIEIGLWFGLLFGLTFGFIPAMYNGGSAILGHIVLRYYLAQDGHIPRWRYDKFLDYAHELVILRKVGGGYRFVHDYLRQYLARSPFVPDGVVGEE